MMTEQLFKKTGFFQSATIAGLRHALETRLVSSRGRPRLEGVFVRQHKIPLDAASWEILKYIAKRLRCAAMKPTAGQIASLLISQEIEKLVAAGRLDDAPALKKRYEETRR